MSDTYQAVYDAVRSRIQSVNVSEVVRDAIDFSWAVQAVKERAAEVAYEYSRPSVLWRPSIARDGDMWCVLYGANLMEGIAGFGKTVDDAMANFDKEWRERKVVVAKAAK